EHHADLVAHGRVAPDAAEGVAGLDRLEGGPAAEVAVGGGAVEVDDLAFGSVVVDGLLGRGRAGGGVVERPVPDLVGPFHVDLEVGVEAGVDRVGLRTGVGVDAVAAVAEQVCQVGDVVGRGVDRDGDVQVLAGLVGQQDLVLPDLVAVAEGGLEEAGFG